MSTRKCLAFLGLFAAVIVSSCDAEKEPEKPKEKTRKKAERKHVLVTRDSAEFTDRHFRVVWAEAADAEQKDAFVNHAEFRLMGLDSHDGKGARPLRDELQCYRRPILTSDGTAVVWTDSISREHWTMKWDGSGVRKLGTGYAVDTWKDPVNGREWVYAGRKATDEFHHILDTVERFPLSDPSKVEPVWNATKVAFDNFQLPRGGKTFASLFPWPHGGIGDPATGTWKKFARGCWGSIAPDDSGLLWIFDGPHKNLIFYATEQERKWEVPVNDTALLDGHEVYHPRWSNSPRFFVQTGPYTADVPGMPSIFGGGRNVEIYAGRFSEDFSRVEAYFRVTENNSGDFYPDLWVEGGESENLDLTAIAEGKPKGLPAYAYALAGWPAKGASPIFLWDTGLTANEVSVDGVNQPCHLVLQDRARYGAHSQLVLGGGRAVTDPATAARILEAFRDGDDFAFQILVTSSDFEFEGERPFLTLGTVSDGALFQLVQKAGIASIRYRNGEAKELSPLQGTARLDWSKPTSLTVLLRKGKIQIYKDGTQVSGARVPLDRSGWPQDLSDSYLVLGAPHGSEWQGALEKLVVYPHDMDDALIDASSDTIRAAVVERDPIPSVEMNATLVETRPVPDPESLGAYTRALVVYRYKVDKVIEGTYDGEFIQVAHYAVMDRKTLGTFPRGVGNDAWLKVEPFESHPQLSSERRTEADFDLDLWYDVTTPMDEWPK